jgi:hypothetical protein
MVMLMLEEGEVVDDSILVLIEEREMVEGRLIGSAHGQGDNGVGEARDQVVEGKESARAVWRRLAAMGAFCRASEEELMRHKGDCC